MLAVLAVGALPAAIASCNRGYAMRFQGAMPILGTREAFMDFSDTGMSDVDTEVTIAMWAKWDDYDPAFNRELYTLCILFNVSFHSINGFTKECWYHHHHLIQTHNLTRSFHKSQLVF